MSDALPPSIWLLVKTYLAAGKTGSIELHVKEGRVVSYRLVECGRVDNRTTELAIVGERR